MSGTLARNLAMNVLHECVVVMCTADFGFARFLQDGVMAATLCGSPMYMVCVQ